MKGGPGVHPGGVAGEGSTVAGNGKNGKDGKGKKGKKNGDTSNWSYGKRGEGRGEGRGSSGHREEGGHHGADGKDKPEDKGKGVSLGDKGTGTTTGPVGGNEKMGQGQPGPTEGETGSTQALMSEVTSLLKSMRISQSGPRSSQEGARSGSQVMKPAISAVRLKRVEVGKESSVLLDGGATNCLRKAGSWKEYEEGRPVQVSLASGTAEMRQQINTGTLLVLDDVQPIVPISDLVNGRLRDV